MMYVARAKWPRRHTRALIGAPPAEPRLAAMLAEVAAGNLGDLVLLPAASLDELSTRQGAAAIREVRLWRASAVADADRVLPRAPPDVDADRDLHFDTLSLDSAASKEVRGCARRANRRRMQGVCDDHLFRDAGGFQRFAIECV